MFSSDEMKGKWKEIKGEIGKKWGELTQDEFLKTGGNTLALIGLLQQKYGVKKSEARAFLNDVAMKFKRQEKAAERVLSNTLNSKIDSTKVKLRKANTTP